MIPSIRNTPTIILNRDRLFFLVALALFLALVESAIPRPVPFFRLGLANLPLLLALNKVSFKNYILLAILKILSTTLLAGTFFSPLLFFSIGGTMVSSLTMYSLNQLFKGRFSLPAISCAGAFVHTLVQFVLAYFFFFGPASTSIVIPMLVMGLVSAWILGWIASAVDLSDSAFSELHKELTLLKKENTNVQQEFLYSHRKDKKKGRFHSILSILLVSILVCSLPLSFMLISNPFLRLPSLVLCLLVITIWLKKPLTVIFTSLSFVVILMFNAIVPAGEIIFTVGGLHVFRQSGLIGLERATLFTGLLVISRMMFLSGVFTIFNRGFFSEIMGWYHLFLDHPGRLLQLFFGNREDFPAIIQVALKRSESKKKVLDANPPVYRVLFLILLFLINFSCTIFNCMLR